MNRRQKIIVSVVGIFIVLFALVGLTYGYFLTRIQGNTNTTSITVTTADLELTYGDGTTEILTKSNIMPDTVIGTKDFTVTNNGNDTEYVVVIEDVLVTYAENGTTIDGDDVTKGEPTTFNSPTDFVYTLTCTKSDGTKCNGVDNSAFPMKNTKNIIVGNDILAGETHNYNLTVTYLETGENQSKDMNKSLQAKVNIEDIRRINPYKDNTSSLAYNIINNSINAENGTQLMATPLTEPAKSQSGYTAQTNTFFDEKVLSIAQDDYGTSYYYRGMPEDNYVNFNNMCWRIVRIEGDGSIKLILEDIDQLCDSKDDSGNFNMNRIGSDNKDYTYGFYDADYDYSNNTGTILADYEGYTGVNKAGNAVTGLKTASESFLTTYLSNVSDLLKSDYACFGDTSTKYNSDGSVASESATTWYYDNYIRLVTTFKPTLKCFGKSSSKYKVTSITGDEATFAGVKYFGGTTLNYLRGNVDAWTTSIASVEGRGYSPRPIILTIQSNTNWNLDAGTYVTATNKLRPTISLINNIEITSGNGTQVDPYEINVNN